MARLREVMQKSRWPPADGSRSDLAICPAARHVATDDWPGPAAPLARFMRRLSPAGLRAQRLGALGGR